MAHNQPVFDLLGLPQEIVVQIIEHEVHNKDLENLALCSKAIFALSRPALTKHLDMKRKYSTFIFGDVDIYGTAGSHPVPREAHPNFACSELLMNPAIADYCKILRIGGVDRDGYHTGVYQDSVYEEARRLYSQLLLQLEELLQKHPCAECNEAGERIEPAENVEGYLIYEVPFMLLKKIELLELDGNSSYCAPCPLIEEVHMECSAISAWTFDCLLRSMKALRVFYYEQRMPRYCGPRSTLKILQQYASESLESLTFVVPETGFGYGGGEQSLRDFKTLKHIAIDSLLLIHYVEVETPSDSSDDEGLITDGVSRLVDVLPPTLETIELYLPRDRKTFERTFEGLAELREERLPKLRSISLHQGTLVNRTMRRKLKKLGIELAFVDGPKRRWSCSK
ncbi:MAG: hypothetical protein Q9226_005782 [Calogaya cf. arnoldii]